MILQDDNLPRQPRRGDVVVAAPFGDNCVAGEVITVRAGRLTLKSATHGNLTLPLARFTWKPKARHWVCWPTDMEKVLARYDRIDEAQARARFGVKPEVGDVTLIAGKIGWISRLYSRPMKASASLGMTFSTFGGYEITQPGSPDKVKIEADDLVFDVDARVWTQRLSTKN